MPKYLLLTVLSLAIAQHTQAADVASHTPAIAPFVNDDTFAAACVDLGVVNVVEIADTLLKWMPAGVVDPTEWMAAVALADGMVRQLQQSGIGHTYMVIGIADIHHGGGPLAIVTARAGQSIDTVEQKLRGLKPFVGERLEVQRKDDVVLIGTKSTVARYLALKPADRADLVGPLMSLVDHHALATVVFCPGLDFRRVVRELWPELPGVLAPFKGDMADRWQHAEAVIDRLPNANPRMSLVAKDAAATQVAAQLWRDMPIAYADFVGDEQHLEHAKAFAHLLTHTLQATVEGERITIGFPANEDRRNEIRSVLAVAANHVLEEYHLSQRRERLKELALGLLNFESANKHFPPAAICDKDGKPLLSWRVAILPYMEYGELYRQFHLDEPWDSPHNAALIPKMPQVFADPDFQLKQLARESKTTYQAPVGPETIFHDTTGTTFREIKDEISETILLVEVAPREAVVWTKPADWEVDLAKPRIGIERSERDLFTAAFADGDVQTIPFNEPIERLRAFLTRAGGEVIAP